MDTTPTTDAKKHHKASKIIRTVYLYLVSMIGLIVFIIGCVGTIDNVVKNFIFHVDYNYNYTTPFPKGDSCHQSYPSAADPTGKQMIAPTTQEIADCEVQMQKQNEQNRINQIGTDFSISFAQLFVGLPVWLFHWSIIQRENKRKEEEGKA
jgi:hypothetical protein